MRCSLNCIALKETKWCFLRGVHPTLFPYYLVLILCTHCTLVKICNHWKVSRHCGGSVDVGKSRDLIGPYSGTHPRCHHCHQQWWIQRDNSGDDDDIRDYNYDDEDEDEDGGWWVEVAWTMIILCKRKQCNSPSCTPALIATQCSQIPISLVTNLHFEKLVNWKGGHSISDTLFPIFQHPHLLAPLGQLTLRS